MTAMREIRIHPMLPDTPVAWPLPTWLDTAAAARWRPGRGGTPWGDLDDDTRVWVAAETIRLVVGR